MTVTALLDGDVIVHKAVTSNIIDTGFEQGEDGEPVLHFDHAGAHAAVDYMVNHWVTSVGADTVVVCLSDKSMRLPNGKTRYWRHDWLPTYKGGRKVDTNDVATFHRDIHSYMDSAYHVERRPLLEADDVLGILATHPSYAKWGQRILVSIDKDFRQLPVPIWNPDKPQLHVHEYSPDEADYYYCYQTLIGDNTDGYKGCPGVGPVKAEELLDYAGKHDDPQRCRWTFARLAFQAAKASDQFETQRHVARILRHGDYNYRTRLVNLKDPPCPITSESIAHFLGSVKAPSRLYSVLGLKKSVETLG